MQQQQDGLKCDQCGQFIRSKKPSSHRCLCSRFVSVLNHGGVNVGRLLNASGCFQILTRRGRKKWANRWRGGKLFSFATTSRWHKTAGRGKHIADRQAIIPRRHDCSERSCHVLGCIDLSWKCQDVAGGQEGSRNSTAPERTSTSATRGAEQEGREMQNGIVWNFQTQVCRQQSRFNNYKKIIKLCFF